MWIAALQFERLLTWNGWELLVFSHLIEHISLFWIVYLIGEWRRHEKYLELFEERIDPAPQLVDVLYETFTEQQAKNSSGSFSVLWYYGKQGFRAAGETHSYLKDDGPAWNLSCWTLSCKISSVSCQKDQLRQLSCEPCRHVTMIKNHVKNQWRVDRE